MKKLWASNFLLNSIVVQYESSVEDLEQCYSLLLVNGASQCVGGYHVASASLCFPVPLKFVLENVGSMSYRQLAHTLLSYFERGDPYLPVEDVAGSTIPMTELLHQAEIYRAQERYEQAISCWEQAAEQESAEAQYCLWEMHSAGWGGLDDFDTGLSYLEKSAAQGYGKAELVLAEHYSEEIIGGSHYAEKAIYWGIRAFEHGIAEAAYIVGNMYAVDRPGVKRDDAKAFDWYRKSGEAGHAHSQYHVAVSYEHGLGVTKNAEAAHRWYMTAREHGHDMAHNSTLGAPIPLAEAARLAMSYLCKEGRGNTTVEADDLPPPGRYGFDPRGWMTFRVDDRFPSKVGGDEYIAVNVTTGEVQSLGIIGE